MGTHGVEGESPKKKSNTGRNLFVIVLVAGAVAGASYGWAAITSPTLPKLPGKNDVTAAAADKQAQEVAAEDRRLLEVRAVTAVAATGKDGAKYRTPYRLNTGSGYTLVLTQRTQPYTITDLLKLAPQTFTRLKDGSYLLAENLYVNAGAKLVLSNPGGLTIRMFSNSGGFVSIVSFGGSLTFQGTEQQPMRLLGWDPRTSKPDTEVADGRAYVRAIGGQFKMESVQAADLGFWSGRTGGISLTGTDRPNTGSTKSKSGGTPGQTGSATPGSTNKLQKQARKKRLLSTGSSGTDSGSGLHAGDVYAAPPGKLTTPDQRFNVPGESYVSGAITKVEITGNAYGLFISGANGIAITDVTIDSSLVDGIDLHRFTRAATLERVTSRRNRGDGFVVARAAQDIRISGATAEGNGGNGFSLNGSALAQGPSAAGESVVSYGNNTISNSVARNNAHYGIEVLGGLNVSVQNNRVEGGDMGIVARQNADQVMIAGNQVTKQKRHGISLRDGVTNATVTGNAITGDRTGIYLRGATATIRGNTVIGATLHGVSMVGQTKGTLVSYNVVAGAGPSAVDRSRSSGGIQVDNNQTGGWHDTSTLWVKIQRVARPMNIIWTLVFLLVVVSAIRSRNGSSRGSRSRGVHPYALQKPMEERPARTLHTRDDRVKAFAE